MQTEIDCMALHEESDHNDPRYRRMRPSHFPPYEKDTSQEDLIKKYLPYVSLICWVGLLITLLFAVDYFITPNSFQEKIKGVEWVSRGHNMHFYSVSTSHGRIKVYDNQARFLKKEILINVKRSRIFKTVMALETVDSTINIRLGYIYKSLVFFPIVLFLTSLLGLVKWKGFEFPFNLSIVTTLLVVINMALVIMRNF
jgi:hypothetical protein